MPAVPVVTWAVAVALRTKPVGVCSTFWNTEAEISASSPALLGVLTSGKAMVTVPDAAPPSRVSISVSNSTMWKLLRLKNAVPAGEPLGEVLMVMKRVSPLGVPPITSALRLSMEPPGPVTRAMIWLLVVVAGGVPMRGSGQLSPSPVPAVLALVHRPPVPSAGEQ